MTEKENQEKRDKVIKGLECCTSIPNEYGDCMSLNCLYKGPSCCNDVMRDALALLKAQEPRVFNVGDFFGEEFGYLEYRTDRPGFSNFDPSPVLIGDIDDENVTVIFRSASVQKLPLDRMNKNWRIWSDYPTHELLRTVKWE